MNTFVSKLDYEYFCFQIGNEYFCFQFEAPILSHKIGPCQAFFNNLFFVCD